MVYYIAVQTDQPVSKGMHAYEIPASTWVVFEGEGPYHESIRRISRGFLTQWLPFSGYTYAEMPDMEVYPQQKDSSGSGRCEVWIGIKKEREMEQWNIK